MQPAVAWLTGGQTLPQAPQLARSPSRLAAQPFAAFLSQSPKPALQEPPPQTPPEHPAAPGAMAGQVWRQPSQLALSLVGSTHPF